MSTAQKKKSICFDALNIKRGGGVTVAHRLITSFARAGWEVHVILSSQEVVDLKVIFSRSSRNFPPHKV